MFKNMIKKILFLLFMFNSLIFFYSQDLTSDKKTVIIALDKSTSMKEEIESVKEYVLDLIDNKINIGDNLIIIPFYGKYDTPINLTVKSNIDKEVVKKRLKKIFATGWYTDIGNALDVLKKEVDKLTEDPNKKILIMVTDGIHDPPPSTKYKTKEAYSNNELLLNAKEEIVKEGWKVIYLDIGGRSDPAIVDKLATHYVEVKENLPQEELSKEIKERMPSLETRIYIDGKIKFTPVNSKGRAAIIIPLKIENLKQSEVMSIENIQFLNLIIFKIKIINPPHVTKFVKDGKVKIKIPLTITGDLKPGKYKDSIKFTFSENTKEHFNRIIDDVEFKINTFFENYLFLILFLVLVLLSIIILCIYLIYEQLSKSKIKFKLIVEELTNSEKNNFKLVQGKFLYLNEENNKIFLSKNRTLSSIGRLSCIGKRLKLSVLNDEKIPNSKDFPLDMLGHKFEIINDKKQVYHVKFEKI